MRSSALSGERLRAMPISLDVFFDAAESRPSRVLLPCRSFRPGGVDPLAVATLTASTNDSASSRERAPKHARKPVIQSMNEIERLAGDPLGTTTAPSLRGPHSSGSTVHRTASRCHRRDRRTQALGQACLSVDVRVLRGAISHVGISVRQANLGGAHCTPLSTDPEDGRGGRAASHSDRQARQASDRRQPSCTARACQEQELARDRSPGCRGGAAARCAFTRQGAPEPGRLRSPFAAGERFGRRRPRTSGGELFTCRFERAHTSQPSSSTRPATLQDRNHRRPADARRSAKAGGVAESRVPGRRSGGHSLPRHRSAARRYTEEEGRAHRPAAARRSIQSSTRHSANTRDPGSHPTRGIATRRRPLRVHR